MALHFFIHHFEKIYALIVHQFGQLRAVSIVTMQGPYYMTSQAY